jgi:Domain of unknown function (DUF4105)
MTLLQTFCRGVIFACVFAATALGSTRARAEPGDDLTAYVLTFGPGEHPFLKFGHNAILVQPANGTGWVFNFGTFDFQDPALLTKFLRGRFNYWLSVGGAEATFEAYASENRTIISQELDLSPAERWKLWQSLRENAKPENRAYLYDYFYDNCSTRVRDAIDRVTGGRVQQAGQAPSRLTLRAHALRSTVDFLPEYIGLYIGLARASDVPIRRWEESFLPERLTDLLRQVRIPDGTGEKNLVKSEKIIYQSTRPAKPTTPPNWGGYFAGTGVVLGLALFFFGRLARRLALARYLMGGITSLLGLVLGFIGTTLACFWAFTNHKIAYANANILQFAPWALALLGYGVGVALGWRRATRIAAHLVLAALVFSVLGIVGKALPGLNQDNWPIILFCLPLWFGLWTGLRQLGQAQG